MTGAPYRDGLGSASAPESCGLGPTGAIPSAEEYGTAGYFTKGRLAATQYIIRAPNGTLLFECDRKNGVDGVIIDWIGDGVIIIPADKFAALATLLCAKPFMEQAGIGAADQHVTRSASAIEAPSGVETGNTDSTEGESAAPQEDAR